jgi:hypothetical protein
MPAAPARPKVTGTGIGKEEGVVRRSLYGGLVVIAGVILAFVSVALSAVMNH